MAEDTRGKILKSAVQLFSKNNYHVVSMSEIAEGAGISKGTLYWHFDSKEDLFREITIDGMNYFNEQFERIAETDQNSEEKIQHLIKFVLRTFVEHLNMIDVFRNNIELISTEFKNTIEKKHERNIGVVAKIIKQGIDEGLIKTENPVDISTMILSVLFTPQTKHLLDTDQVEKKINFIYDFIMNGISRKEK
jgi:AcrR family transcriptional regulator